MIEVYVCHKPHYEALLKDKLQQDAVIYPEIEIPYYGWFDHYTENKNTMKQVVTQSSEFIKFLRANEVKCKIMVLDNNEADAESFVERKLEETTALLLDCYQNLTITEALLID